MLGKEFGKMEQAAYGRTRYGKKNGQAGRSIDLVQKMLGLCATKNGTKTDEPLQAGEKAGTEEYGKMFKRIQVLEDGRIHAKEARN